jgi:hypothetical protein
MRIMLQPAWGPAEVHLASDEVRRALEVLSAAHIKTDGGGTIESDGVVTGVIVLRFEGDAPQALELLARAGITAAIG